MFIYTNSFVPQVILSGLTIRVNTGVVFFASINQKITIPATFVVLAASSTNYVYLDCNTQTVVSNTSGFPSNSYPIALAVTSYNGINNLTDFRSEGIAPTSGGSVSGVTSLNSLTGDLSLVGGSNITVTPVGNNITIAATGLGTGTVTHTGTLTSGAVIVGNGGVDVKTGDLSGDISTSGSTVTTLPNVNSNVGTFTDATITVNAKGQVTAAASGSGTYAKTVASGSTAMRTSAISGSTADTPTSVSAPGVLTTDVVSAGFNGIPTGITGFVPGSQLTVIAYPTADHINLMYVNNTGSSITPSAVTLNWRVTR